MPRSLSTSSHARTDRNGRAQRDIAGLRQPAPLAAAVARVAEASDRVVADRFELLRRDARADLRLLAGAVVFGIGGGLVVTSGLGFLLFAAALALRAVVPLPLGFALAGLLLAGLGWTLVVVARQRFAAAAVDIQHNHRHERLELPDGRLRTDDDRHLERPSA